MPATVYERVCLYKEEFSRKDLRKIANWINSLFRIDNPEDPPKIEQIEGDKTFKVFCYPDEFISDMDRIVGYYFNKKERKAEKHLEYLEDLKNKAEGIETGEKENKPNDNKKFNSTERKSNSSQSKGFKKNGKKPSGNKFNFTKPYKHKDASINRTNDIQGFKVKTPDETAKREIPVATTLRKRKTPPGAII